MSIGDRPAIKPAGTMKRGQEPNNLLRRARLGLPSPSGSGERMSREELADVVSRRLGSFYAFGASYVGDLERGKVRWPSAARRKAFREVFGVGSDAELGFYPTGSSADRAFVAEHDVPLTVAAPVVSLPLPKAVGTVGAADLATHVPILAFAVRPAADGGVEVAVHAADGEGQPLRLGEGSAERTA